MRAPFTALLLLLPLLLLAGCSSVRESGHAHGDAGHAHESGGHSHESGGHSHESGGHSHGDEDEGPKTSFTLFTATHELFVELDVPVAGEWGAHHAHVTRLEDNAPATSGSFAVAFLDPGDSDRIVQAYSVGDVARTGIFTPKGRAPEGPGPYRLLYRYQAADEVAEWEAGVVEVGREPVIPDESEEGEITFLKETSWFLPFRVRRPELAPIARNVTLAARVEADPRSSASVPAPASGRVLFSFGDEMTLAGDAVEAGAVLARLIPDSSFESWNALLLKLQQAGIELERASAELGRVEGLVADGLIPERRLAEARATRDQAAAALAGARRDRTARQGEAPALELRAPFDGLVLELLLDHGERVEAGRPVLRVASTERVLLRGTLRGARPQELTQVSHAVARPGDPEDELDLLAAGAVLLGRPLLVDPRTSGMPITWSVPNDGHLLIGELVELSLGVGEPVERLTIPVGAVVEVNTRPQAFVQRTGESFERRGLVLGDSDGVRVAVLEGLQLEELVVTVGGFDVYVASLSGSVESHRH